MGATSTLSLETEQMIARKDGGVGWMIFNNPERRNALSVAMRAAIPVILENFNEDPGVRVVVMTGAGDKAFVSGADISQFEQERSDPVTIAAYDEQGRRVEAAFAALDKPLIAMIRGVCMGGGLLTALRADIRIASDDAQFGIPAARLGLGYGYGGVRVLMDFVGPAVASEILFTGGRFPAADALRWGLVNRVVPAAELMAEARKLAAQLAASAPIAMRYIINAVNKGMEMPFAEACQYEATLFGLIASTEDMKEGTRAFLEKRKASFQGR
jgi:enoyl-CoA hydratase/carnithine racemase